MRVELLPGCSLGSFRVKASNSVRRDLRRGRFLVPCERSVLSGDRHASLWRERYSAIVFPGRLATWRDYFGFIGGEMSLCAGREQSRT